MSEKSEDWSELQRTWQSQPAGDPAELEAVRASIVRADRAARLRTALDVVSCVIGAVLGVAALLRGTPSGLVIGLAALAFTAFGGWLAWRSARGRRHAPTGTVVAALDAAIALERAAEGWARAAVTMGVAATVFLAVVALATAADAGADAAQLRRVLEAIAVALIAVAIASVVVSRLGARSLRRRQVLERRRAELVD